jgi:hypothetical protein
MSGAVRIVDRLVSALLLKCNWIEEKKRCGDPEIPRENAHLT